AFWDVTRGVRLVTKELIDTPKTEIEWIERGNILSDNKNYKEALSAYNHTLSINPDSIVAYNNKGKVLFDLKRYTEAVIVFDKAINSIKGPSRRGFYFGIDA